MGGIMQITPVVLGLLLFWTLRLNNIHSSNVSLIFLESEQSGLRCLQYITRGTVWQNTWSLQMDGQGVGVDSPGISNKEKTNTK